MITVNALANALPINGQTTAVISDFYKNLFTPIGTTFAIWGVIYFMLACYAIYQLGFLGKEKNEEQKKVVEKVGILFIVSSIANALWIFAWHYNIIVLSVLFMLIILYCLIIINKELFKIKLSMKERILIKAPFSIYFGWITVATIANIIAMLIAFGVEGFGQTQLIITSVIIIVGFIIASLVVLKNKDFLYGLVIIWSYLGIYLKHTLPEGFNNQYPIIINTVIISLILLLFEIVYVLIKKLKK